jgi:hypothetical protein
MKSESSDGYTEVDQAYNSNSKDYFISTTKANNKNPKDEVYNI